MTLSDRLQALLKQKGFTIYAAAELAGMSKQQAWKIVAGKARNPGYLTVQRIVEAVGGRMADLDPDED
jgi:transcriptional regulator with XRE-family HTH domain